MASWARPETLPPAIALIGPTASGKSALSLAIAARWPCEIISMDSALVYRGMDIGTAKPTAQELAQVPHHLIDILDPSQSYSAAQFARDAERLVAEIRARGKLALVVGGTMLYLKAWIQGLDPMPSASAELRASIDAQARQQGWPALHAQLAQVDPITAARLAPNDAQRIQRALEVYHASGQPISFFQQNRGPALAKSESNAIDSVANIPIISLEPTERSWLHTRIAQRFDDMLAQGLVQEVMQLKQRADLHLDLPSMRCVGYRQVWEMLDGAFALSELRDKGIAATRQLAKRQITWQRSMQAPLFQKHVIAADAPTALADTLALLSNWLD